MEGLRGGVGQQALRARSPAHETSSHVQTPAGCLLQPASLVALLARAGVAPSSVVRVTGPSALSAILCFAGTATTGWPTSRAAQRAPRRATRCDRRRTHLRRTGAEAAPGRRPSGPARRGVSLPAAHRPRCEPAGDRMAAQAGRLLRRTATGGRAPRPDRRRAASWSSSTRRPDHDPSRRRGPARPAVSARPSHFIMAPRRRARALAWCLFLLLSPRSSLRGCSGRDLGDDRSCPRA